MMVDYLKTKLRNNSGTRKSLSFHEMERRRPVRAFVLVPGGRGAEMRTGLLLTLFGVDRRNKNWYTRIVL